MLIGVAVAELVVVAVAFMLLLPRVVVPPPPTRIVSESEVVVVRTEWLPLRVADVLAAKDELTRTDGSPPLRVMVVL